MRITITTAITALAAFALSANVATSAPETSPVLKTGQTICYDSVGAVIDCAGTGQDGELQLGVERSFTDNGDGTITDNVTGLMWEKQSDDGSIHDWNNTYTWPATFSTKIATLNSESFAGHGDWRVPNARELETLVSLAANSPATYPAFDTNCVPGCTAQTCSCTQSGDFYYWSSTTPEFYPSLAWATHCISGSTLGSEKWRSWGVRGVRGGSSVLKTGQTACYDENGGFIDCTGTGQDGEFRMGVPRNFTDNGDGTITDNITGLMWEKLSDDGSIHDQDNHYSWTTAFGTKIATLNAERFAGHDDWRLPNSREIYSLSNFGTFAPAAFYEFNTDCAPGCTVLECSCTRWAGPGPNPQSYSYWASSTYDAIPSLAWGAHPLHGAEQVVGPDKFVLSGVRAVRDGATVCGNGTLDAGEDCDDGNTAVGDCCSSTCQVEPASTVCRAAVGPCDIAEYCDGLSGTCPDDEQSAADTWTPTASISSRRWMHTATPLPDGRVLVVGGYDDTAIVATAEIYDPALAAWSSTGSMGTNRFTHAAALLLDGRVLVIGGDDGHSMWDRLNTAEIYDPALGTWSPTGSMGSVRESPGTTVLSDGRVLVSGGGYANGGYWSTAEIYDPALGTWSPTGSMGTPRYAHTSTLLPDGRVLVTGGTYAYPPNLFTNSAEIYNPDTGNWSPAASMSVARYGHTASLLPGGRVLVVGGSPDNSTALATAEIYDPVLGTWTFTESLTTPRYFHTATPLPSGRVLVAGGHGGGIPMWDNNGAVTNAEVYDPALGTWAPTPPMNEGRYTHTATLLNDGRVLLVGAYDDTDLAAASAEIYTPTAACLECGNGSVDDGEACDDGNTAAGDCCSAACQFESSSTVCRAPIGPCDLAELCTGSSDQCPADIVAEPNTECRPLAGVCDTAESCDGASSSCPADGFLSSATTCRAAAGICDLAESCTGSSAACPADAKSTAECRASSGVCDAAESCDGTSSDCPADRFLSSETTCRASSGACDIAETCSGISATCPGDAVAEAGTACRSNADACDSAETCTGTTKDCPADTVAEAGVACATDDDECTRDVCDGQGACAHPPIPLAPTCNWAVLGGSDSQAGNIRTRTDAEVDGSICADTADIGEYSALLDAASWALLAETGTAARVRPGATVTNGSVATAGGCLTGLHGGAIFGTMDGPICCADGDVELPGGNPANVINACGTDPLVDRCIEAKAQIADDIALLDSLPATASLGLVAVAPGGARSILAGPGLNVMEVDRLVVKKGGTLTIDAQGNPAAVIVLRLANGMNSRMRARIVLAGGALPGNVLFYAPDGNCIVGWGNEGAGTLFCPAGKVGMRVDAVWTGAIAGGATVDVGWNAKLTHVPFLGLAE